MTLSLIGLKLKKNCKGLNKIYLSICVVSMKYIVIFDSTNNKDMTFTQILQSKFYHLIESIEHGSSDKSIIEMCKKELFEKTGYKYID